MNCKNCQGVLESVTAVVYCPYCGTANQIADVILALALRIRTINNRATPIIPTETALPYAMSEVFSTGMDNQTSVEIHLQQGNSDQADQNRNLGRFILGNIAPQPKGVPRIQFNITIDQDGRLEVVAQEQGTTNRQVYRGMQLAVIRK